VRRCLSVARCCEEWQHYNSLKLLKWPKIAAWSNNINRTVTLIVTITLILSATYTNFQHLCAGVFCCNRHVNEVNKLETKTIAQARQCIPAGYSYAHMLIIVSGIYYILNSKTLRPIFYVLEKKSSANLRILWRHLLTKLPNVYCAVKHI